MTQFSQRAQYFSYLIWTSLTSNPEFIKKCPMGSGIGYDPITKNERIEYLFSLIEKALTPMQSGSKSGAPSIKLLYDPVSFTFFLMVDAREFRIGSYEQNSENNNIALTLIGASGEERKLVIAYDPSRLNENFYQFSTELRSEYAHSPEMKTSNSFFKGIKRDITPSPTFQTQSQMNVYPILLLHHLDQGY
jgi:hypothetical protein